MCCAAVFKIKIFIWYQCSPDKKLIKKCDEFKIFKKIYNAIKNVGVLHKLRDHYELMLLLLLLLLLLFRVATVKEKSGVVHDPTSFAECMGGSVAEWLGRRT